MNLYQTIKAVERAAASQPNVQMIVRNDVFRLNEAPDRKYGVFAWLQGEHTGTVQGYIQTFAFTFFYVDRLTEDKGNEVEVQSAACEVLHNILLELSERGFGVNDYRVRTFNQRFTDECAGAFANVSIEVPVDSACAEMFADFNEDFNEDFLIY